MPRVKRGVAKRRRHKRILKAARGAYGARSRLVRVARENVERGLRYAYRDRKQRKRDMRGLWIVRINAAAREHGLSYNRLIAGLKTAGVLVDRKILAALALDQPKAFAELAALAKSRVAPTAA